MVPEPSARHSVTAAQKIVFLSLVLNGVLLLISILTRNASPGILQTLLGICYVAVAVLSLYSCYRLATALGFSTPRVVLALLLMFVPVANLITLAVLYQRATHVLREGGPIGPGVHSAPLP